MSGILNESDMEENVQLAKQVLALQQQVLEFSDVSCPSPSVLNLITNDAKTRFYMGCPHREYFKLW